MARGRSTSGSGAAARGGRLRVTLVGGWAGKGRNQLRTLRALGLRRRGDSNDLPDAPSVRGAITVVSHLVRVEPLAD